MTQSRLLLTALTLLGIVACREAVTAPGACPEYCPGSSIQTIDSLLSQAIRTDSTFRGYVAPQGAGALQVVHDPAGTGLRSRAIIRFLAFPESLLVRLSDTVRAPVTAVDSFRIDLPVRRRLSGATGLELAVYRLPATVDTLATFAGLDPWFQDSTLLGVIALADTLRAGTVSAVLADTAFPSFAADGRVAAVGVALRGPDAAFVDLGAIESGSAARLTRYARIDSAGTAVARTDARDPGVDLFAGTGIAPAGAGELAIGGAPAARALMRFDLPARVVDSSRIVRATLVFVPTGPAPGAPGDTVLLLAHAVTTDVGAKSPILVVPLDSIPLRTARLRVGSQDTVRLDVTDILLRWQATPAAPRTMVIRTSPEGVSFAEARFTATGGGVGPALQVTFVPPLILGGR